MSDTEDSPRDPPDRLRFQFSLRSQLIVVTLIAVILGLLVVVGKPIAWMMFHGVVYCLAPTPLVIGALFGRDELRTFCIGALVPWISTWGQSSPMLMIFYSPDPSTVQFGGWMIGTTIYILVAGGACGALAVVTRRWLARRTDG